MKNKIVPIQKGNTNSSIVSQHIQLTPEAQKVKDYNSVRACGFSMAVQVIKLYWNHIEYGGSDSYVKENKTESSLSSFSFFFSISEGIQANAYA